MNRNYHLVSACALALGILSSTSSAHAFGEKSHALIVEKAVDAMANVDERLPYVTNVPSDTALWNEYLDAVRAAPAKLGTLRTDLPSATGFKQSCGYSTRVDWSQLPQMRIAEMPGLPPLPEEYWHDECAMQPAVAGSTDILGRVLGWHAGNADNNLADLRLGLAAMGLWSQYPGIDYLEEEYRKQVTAILAEDPAVILALAPITVLITWLMGDDVNWETIQQNTASTLNPDTLLPTITPLDMEKFDGKEFVGMWHFIVPGGSAGKCNDLRGLQFSKADEIFGRYSMADAAIMAATDALSFVVSERSEGIDRYTPYDDRDARELGYWTARGLADSEFSNIGGLGQYGWDRLVNRAGGSAHLGYALHAIADAANPHHLAGTTGFGHASSEEVADEVFSSFFAWRSDADNSTTREAAALVEGFELYKEFRDNRASMKRIVEWAAGRNWAKHLAGDFDWAFVYEEDLIEVRNGDGTVNGNREKGKYRYDYEWSARLADLITDSVGHEIGVLVLAADMLTAAPAGANCSGAEYYDFDAQSCVPTPTTPPPPPPDNRRGIGEPCTDGNDCVTIHCVDGFCSKIEVY